MAEERPADEETLVPDQRSGLRPRDYINQRLARMLKPVIISAQAVTTVRFEYTAMTTRKLTNDVVGTDALKQLDDMTPEPLYESSYLPGRKLCLRCGKARATSMLYSSIGVRPVLPLCQSCACDWNSYGYQSLKRIKLVPLVYNLLKFKLFHPFSRPTTVGVYRDLRNFLRWVRKMRRLKKTAV